MLEDIEVQESGTAHSVHKMYNIPTLDNSPSCSFKQHFLQFCTHQRHMWKVVMIGGDALSHKRGTFPVT